ncbi:amino acid/polyamine/organocation transporter, APC superfamily [Thermoflavifilum thermophilum]|uniref:Amino acid/polyamine/organocation transporter, APC superfamily n=2 Tax=Thermoflavifilum thermophilum TaxID=1393122 RepID=A0A1I7N3V2_9BACT|nr:amino acid/polyamine/organocation transporter, APC superfamily [Thermoflavifilum thermophilum]
MLHFHQPLFFDLNGMSQPHPSSVSSASHQPSSSSSPGLHRAVTLWQATSINMIEMIGIGPFIVIPLIMQQLGPGWFLIPWLAGALIAALDGLIWSELGAAFPLAGGSYQFLKAAYGTYSWGRLMPFLFVWQTMVQAPLVAASASIGFAQYARYLFPLGFWGQKLLSASIIVCITILLFRRIETIGKISVWLWAGVMLTMIWIIAGGAWSIHIHHSVQGLHFRNNFWQASIMAVMGHATVQAMYSYLGYYNVCHLGAEIKNPARNIPRSMQFSIAGVALLYLLMNISLAQGIQPGAQHNGLAVSIFIEQLFGTSWAKVATLLILWIAFSSLFSLMLGYSRVPYAAASDGYFFPIFSKTHPTRHFPHISLLALSALAFIFSLLFRIEQVISAILAMRILVQFIGQAVGLWLLHRRLDRSHFPFRMIAYPIPLFLSILAWLAIFISTGWKFVLSGLIMIGAGVGVFYLITPWRNKWLKPQETA